MNPTSGILGILIENRPQRSHLNVHNACVWISNEELIFLRLRHVRLMGSCLLHLGTQDIFVTDTLFIIMKVFNQVVKGHPMHNCDRLKKECIFSK